MIDLRSLRNAVMVVSLAAVGAMAVLINQMHNLNIEIKEVAHRHELLRNDLKNLESNMNIKFDAMNTKLDLLVDTIKTKDKE